MAATSTEVSRTALKISSYHLQYHYSIWLDRDFR